MKLKNGILVFSLFLALIATNLLSREVELQFHEVKEFYDPDFNKLHNAGFDKIIVRSFLNNGKYGGLLFENDSFRIAYPGFSKIIKKNRKRKFRLWGWLITRNYDWLGNNDLYDTGFIKGEKQWIRKLNLFDPDARELVIGVFRSIVKLGVDGILIQDDLSIKSDEGFSLIGMKTFSDSSGVPAKEKLMMDSGSPYNLKWIKIKKKIINEFLAEIVRECKSVNPDIKIGVNVFYEASIQKRNSNEWHSQDLTGISGSGVDLIYLMMYHRQMKRELKLGSNKIKKLFSEGIENAYKIAGDRLVVKLETYDWNKSEIIPLKEMVEFIDLIPAKIKRICFTPVKNSGMKYLKGLRKAAEN
ncbi:MAG: family 10 glycosylhydrolase [Candidatus Aminicenantes bacterium]|nr:family 10 glycosylhydrolase [Candidatus Aminicenantes bacterium]MCK5004330.1 family 10 glycosylhydrolase [Candidatus Aminicenantes bacterium]